MLLFAQRGHPFAVQLPHTLVDSESFKDLDRVLHMTSFADVESPGHGQCALEISLRGSPARSSWYDIWAAASAASAMCVRRQRIGVSSIKCEMRLAGNVT